MFWNKYVVLCEKRGKSPSGLAKELGITASTVTSWKKGSSPSADTVYKISQRLDCTADYLISEYEKDILSSNKKHLLRYNGLSEGQKKLCDNFIQAMLMKLIIQLPCEVGSTVYLHTTVRTGRKKEIKIVSGQIDRFIIGDLGVPLADICTDYNVWYYTCSYPGDYFLTYEEAQKALETNNIKMKG